MNCNGKILDENGNLTDEVCGCAITAERTKKTFKNGTRREYNSYRCSNSTRQCSQRSKQHMKEVAGRNKVSYTPEEIEIIFEDIFKSFSFDELTCKRMKDWLWKEHFEEKSKNKTRLDELVSRKYQLEEFIEKSYEDKLSGSLSEKIWKTNTAKWSKERDLIASEIKAIEGSKDEYMHRGVELIELMQHSKIIYKRATPDRKRRLVELVSSNLLLADGSIEYHWNLPFNMLAIKGDFEKWRAQSPRYRTFFIRNPDFIVSDLSILQVA